MKTLKTVHGTLVALAFLTGLSVAHASRVAPTITRAQGLAPRMIVVDWAHPDQAGNPDTPESDRPSGYVVQYKVDGDWMLASADGWNISQLTIVNLEPDTTYQLRVCAVYDEVNTDYCSEPAQARTFTSETSRSSQTPVITGTVPGQRDTRVAWYVPDTERRYSYFQLRFTVKGGGHVDQRVNSNLLETTVTNLQPATTYTFRIRGCDRDWLAFIFGTKCSEWSTPMDATTLYPDLVAPIVHIDRVLNATTVLVAWDAQPGIERLDLTLDDAAVAHLDGATAARTATAIQLPRPNTHYDLRLCWVRQGQEKCSDLLDLIGRPVRPSPPKNLYLMPTSGGGATPASVFLKTGLIGRWTNGPIPGELIELQRRYHGMSSGISTHLTQDAWLSIVTEVAKKDPTAITVPDIASSSEPTRPGESPLSPTHDLRVCATVRAMRTGGEACSDVVRQP